MPRVVFTSSLLRYVHCGPKDVCGDNVAAALEAVFAETPKLRGYILDDQGRLRQHVVVFIDGQIISDRMRLSDSVGESSEVYVMQALSGG